MISEESTGPRFDLPDAFLKRQAKLAGDLGVADIAGHPGTKGHDSELNWLRMLKGILPKRYGVSQAFVVDSQGGQSEQIDVVIHDRHFSPLLFEVGGAKYIPAESVYAAFEVKQQIDKPSLEYGERKLASVRRLYRTSVDIPHAGGRFDPVAPRRIIGGFLARRSRWNPPLGKTFEQCLAALDLEGSEAVAHGIDIGCALEHGAFSVSREPLNPRIGKLEVSAPEVALIFFVMRLLRQLQAIGSAPAIDYDEYLKAIPGTTGRVPATSADSSKG